MSDLTRATAKARSYHEDVDPHHRTSWLADVVLGGQDGLVNVLGVVLGVAASTGNTGVVLAAGLAAAFAESISMAAVAYTSTVAQNEVFESERARERRHVAVVPELEREEVRDIYAHKGFSGELLDRVVETITANKEVWVAVMMAEEHHLTHFERRRSLRSACVVGLSALVGSLVPLAPFLLMPARTGVWFSVVVAALTLFLFGALKGRITVGRPLRGGLELATIGTVSAMVGYAIGAMLPVPSCQ